MTEVFFFQPIGKYILSCWLRKCERSEHFLETSMSLCLSEIKTSQDFNVLDTVHIPLA
jgi:hypothetical protein